MHTSSRREIIVATMGGMTYGGEILSIETSDGLSEQNRYFSMCGSIYSIRTRDALLEFAKESLDDMWNDDLRNMTVVADKIAAMGVEPEWSDYELEGMLAVDEWFIAPDGVEWGVECIGGGQCVDAWERYIPGRSTIERDGPDTRLRPDEFIQVDWVIEPEQYGALIDLWRAHHLKRIGDEGYIVTPQWVVDLANKSISLEQAAARWWWKFEFPQLYFGDPAEYKLMLDGGATWGQTQAFFENAFDDQARAMMEAHRVEEEY
jgi:hypothetical protein